MEVSIQINHRGYRADYRITGFNTNFYYAELTRFSGMKEATPPLAIHFVHDHGETIASSDVIEIAKELTKQLNDKNSFEVQSYQQ